MGEQTGNCKAITFPSGTIRWLCLTKLPLDSCCRIAFQLQLAMLHHRPNILLQLERPNVLVYLACSHPFHVQSVLTTFKQTLCRLWKLFTITSCSSSQLGTMSVAGKCTIRKHTVEKSQTNLQCENTLWRKLTGHIVCSRQIYNSKPHCGEKSNKCNQCENCLQNLRGAVAAIWPQRLRQAKKMWILATSKSNI